MEFVLTGDSASGAEFERLGVVNKVFPRQEVVPAAMKLAERIAVMSGPVTKTAKQAVLTGGLLRLQNRYYGVAPDPTKGSRGRAPVRTPCSDSLTLLQSRIAILMPG